MKLLLSAKVTFFRELLFKFFGNMRTCSLKILRTMQQKASYGPKSPEDQRDKPKTQVNIVLIGFMGSGKSTVAKHLSELLGLFWIEMDHLVYQKTNTRNMHEVFALGGEQLLRETEIAIAKEYAAKKNLIISTGGGVVLNKMTLDCFKRTGGKVIFLNARFDTVVKRLEGDDSRPLFKEQENAKKLYDFRLPLYLNYADQVIDVDSQSADEIALKIKETIKWKGFADGL